jgi:ABC-type branched-subunit amino acid transport system substrate-binding protein
VVGTIRRAVPLALLSAVTLAASASPGDARSDVPGSQLTAPQQLQVAIVIPKTGSFSMHNRLIANGATIADHEINAEGSKKGQAPVHLKLQVVGVRPTASPKRIVQSLVHGSTHVLILPCNIPLQESLARAAAKAGLLTLSPCNPDPTFAKHVARYWPTGTTGTAEAGQLAFYAHYVYAQAKTAFLLGTAHSWYARQMTGELRAAARQNKLRIVGAASVPAGSKGVAGLAKRIRKVAPDIVFAAIPSPSIESIISKLRQKGVRSAFYVTDGMDAGINFLRYRDGPDNSTIENVVFATYGFPRPTSTRFVRDYAAAYGKKPLYSFPGLGYETVHVLETAAQRAATLTPAGLNGAFTKGFTVKGVALEDITYQGHAHRQPVTSVGLAEVIRDAYVELVSSQAGHPTG